MAQLRSVLPLSPSPSCPFPRLRPHGSSRIRVACPPRVVRFACSASGSSSASAASISEEYNPDWSSRSSTPPAPPDGPIAPEASCTGGGGAGEYNGPGGGGSGGDGSGPGRESSAGTDSFLGVLLRGWRNRVTTDPQFPFKVLMEEIVGVGACVIGDMASRPNFGLNELDFVFSTIVVVSILNFALMYMLAPTSAASAVSSLPSIFASCPPGHMFEQGAYSISDRFGTFVYKGALFSAVGFAAGLVGTATSNFLISTRKKIDPSFEPQNKPPPTLLNAATWAIHMGLSCNLRYQTVNGLEFAMASYLHPAAFKASVLVTRTVNNVLGGMSFVALAKVTGSQKAEEMKVAEAKRTSVVLPAPCPAFSEDPTSPNCATPIRNLSNNQFCTNANDDP